MARSAVQCRLLQQQVLGLGARPDRGRETLEVDGLTRADPDPSSLVGICRSDPLQGRADLVVTAHRLGDRVLGLIGVDTFKAVGLPKPPATETAQRMAQLRADFPAMTRGMVAGMLFRPDSDPALVRRVADDMASAPPEVGVPSVIALNEWDGPPVMSRIRAPIVTINADLGPPTPEAVIRGFAPGFRAVVVPGSDHFLMMSDPARVNPILEAEIRALQ